MQTREIASEYRLAHWSQVMRERRESGLSIKAFCLASGFHRNVYYYWQRKLREAACRQVAEIQTLERRMEPAEPCFAEVLLEPAPARAALAGGVPAGRLCVEFAGLQITADSDYPPANLAALVRELARPC